MQVFSKSIALALNARISADSSMKAQYISNKMWAIETHYHEPNQNPTQESGNPADGISDISTMVI